MKDRLVNLLLAVLIAAVFAAVCIVGVDYSIPKEEIFNKEVVKNARTR